LFESNKELEFDSLPADIASLNENSGLEDLVDIRSTPAYTRFIQKLGGKINI